MSGERTSPELQIANSNKIPVTVVIPTKNELRNLPKCFSCLREIQEIVVVDSNSDDGTRDVVLRAGAKLIDFAWVPGQFKKRNWMLSQYKFKTEWVLFLDADEFITDEFKDEMCKAIARTKYVGFWLNYRIYFMGRQLNHGVSQRKLALMRVGAGLYENVGDTGWSDLDMEVHEHPVLDGPVGEISARIDHFDYKDLHHFIKKHNDYSSWEANRALVLEKTADSQHLTRRQRIKYRNIERWWFPIAYFVGAYFIKCGFLDGQNGFLYAAYKYFYFMQVRDKIREARKAGI